jgi:uncharacterized protein
MPAILAALTSGLLFGLGLSISQMINPAKVIAFIDVFGDFDPSLAFVMATAIPVTAVGYALAARRHSPICAPGFNSPTQKQIDRPLLLGAALFGIGWGLVGYCPGPALAALGLGNPATVLFVCAMLVGNGRSSCSAIAAQPSREARLSGSQVSLEAARPEPSRSPKSAGTPTLEETDGTGRAIPLRLALSNCHGRTGLGLRVPRGVDWRCYRLNPVIEENNLI